MNSARLPLRLFAVLFLTLALAGTALTASAQDDATPEATESAGGDEATDPSGGDETATDEGTADEGTTEGEGDDGTSDDSTSEEPTEEATVEVEPTEESDPPTRDEPPAEEATVETEPTEKAGETTDEEDVAADDVSVQQTGSITINKTASDTQQPLGAACFTIIHFDNGVPGSAIFSSCTNQDGELVANNVSDGTYLVIETESPDGYLPVPNQQVTVSNDSDEVLDLVDDPGISDGTFTITKYDTAVNPNNLIGGSCFTVFIDLDADANEILLGPEVVSICDVNDPNPGQVLNRNQLAGNYVLRETLAPPGFDDTPGDFEFSVVAGQDTPLDVINTPQDLGNTGILSITKVDADNPGLTIADMCWSVFEDDNDDRGNQVGTEVCDDDDNGLVNIENLDPGEYLLVERDPFNRVEPIDDVPFSITAGEITPLTVENTFLPPPSSFVMTKVYDGVYPNGDDIGACITVFEDLDEDLGEIVFGDELTTSCDGDQQNAVDGFILSRNQEDGHYVAVETRTPFGFISIDAQEFEVDGPDSPVELVNEAATADTPGKVSIVKHTSGGDLLPGACFRVFEDDNGEAGDPVSDEVCDDDDGQNDGRITIDDLLEGDYILGETDAPDGFILAANEAISIVRGQTLHLTIVDFTQGGGQPSGFIASKVDDDGDPIEDACFTFHEDLDPDPGVVEVGDLLEGSSTLCSQADGFILSRNQEPGDYVAVEETVPGGYAPAPLTEFTVEEDEQTEVEIVNHLAGTLTILKFFCEGDEDAVEFEVDEPDAFDAAGIDEDTCEAGDAEFQITLFADVTFAPFSIGDDGEVTFDDLPETVDDDPHTLTEVDSGESVDFDIAPGEETIVTVFNIEGVDDDDDEDDEDDVEELPDTGVLGSGSGPADGGAGLLALMSLATLGLAYIWQRRRRIA